MSAEVPASRSRKRIGNLVPTPTASPASPKNPFDTTGPALNCGLWTLSGMHQSTCMTPLARMSPVQGCWQFNESSIQGQKTLSFHKPYGQTKDICPYHACVCWNTRHRDQPLAWLQRSKIISLFSKKNCTWTQAWFWSFLPDSWINAASAREVKQMAWDEPRRCLQKFQPDATGHELEILFQHHVTGVPTKSFCNHKTGLGLRTVDSFRNAPKHLHDAGGTNELNWSLLTNKQ